MKKYWLIVALSALLLTACEEKVEIRGGVEHFEGYRTFQSEKLGFQFDYPSETFTGRKVYVKERPPENPGDNLLADIGWVTAGNMRLWVKNAGDVPTSQEERLAYLNDLILEDVDNCKLGFDKNSTDKRETYFYLPTIQTDSPEFDAENCKIHYSIYYFPEKPNQILIAWGQDKPPFKPEATKHFHDSIAAY